VATKKKNELENGSFFSFFALTISANIYMGMPTGLSIDMDKRHIDME